MDPLDLDPLGQILPHLSHFVQPDQPFPPPLRPSTTIIISSCTRHGRSPTMPRCAVCARARGRGRGRCGAQAKVGGQRRRSTRTGSDGWRVEESRRAGGLELSACAHRLRIEQDGTVSCSGIVQW